MATVSAPRVLLDTDTCIYIINKRPQRVFEHFAGMRVGDVAISSITGAELSFGVAKSGSRRNQDALDKFLAPLEIVAFDEAAMREYGPLRGHCRTPRHSDWRPGPVDCRACLGIRLHLDQQQSARIQSCAEAEAGQLGRRRVMARRATLGSHGARK